MHIETYRKQPFWNKFMIDNNYIFITFLHRMLTFLVKGYLEILFV